MKNVLIFADGRELHDNHPAPTRLQVVPVRETRCDFVSYYCGDRYNERLFALVEVRLPEDVAVYRELVS